MAERDRFHESDAGLFIAFPRASYLTAGGFIASLAVLWTAVTGPPLNIAAISAEWASEVALTAAVMAVATMLVAAIGLAAADWLSEIKSRRDWAAIGIAADDLVTPPLVQASDQRDHFYPPVVNNEALWAVLRANRHAARSSVDVRSTDVEAGTWMPVRKTPLPATAAPVVGTISKDERTGTAGGSVVDVVALRRVATGAKHGAQEALRVRASVGLTAVPSRPWQLNGMGVNGLAARRTRLAANDRPWAGWPGPDQRSAPHAVPIKIVSDITILGQGKRPPSGGEPPPCAPPGGSVRSTSVSARTSIVASTASDRRPHPRAAIKSLDPSASAEMHRQLIALAEALARQAAREDDAAEHLLVRSRSPPDVAVEIGRGGRGGEDTS
jgi:hypothetical protein